MPDVWAALVGILAVIECERLYTPISTLRTGNQNMAAYRYPGCASIAVKGLALATIESTGRVWDSNDMPTVTPSVDTHDMLTRIEYELVGDELHRTLGALVTLPRLLSIRATDAVQRLLTDFSTTMPRRAH